MKQQGFTIVELLIVVVVIGILAAIVIVAYNGVTNNAKTASAASTASEIAKKLEIYNAQNNSYPSTYATLTGASSTEAYYIAPNTYTLKSSAVASGDSDKTFNYSNCTSPAGKRISVWNWNTNALVHTYIGGATAASTCTISNS